MCLGRTSILALVLSLTGALVAAAGLTGEQILREAIENGKQQEPLRSQYAYHQHIDLRRVQRDGSPGRQYYSFDYEVLYLEGAPYRKLLATEGKPLKGKQARDEEDRMRMTAAERRAAPAKKGSPTLRAGVALTDVLRLMNHTLLRQEEVRGRKAWVVQSEPKKGLMAASPADAQVLCYRYTFWIDQEDRVASKIQFEVIREGVDGQPGSRAEFLFAKENDSLWMLRNLDSYLITKGKPREFWQQERFSDFKKFSADSTIQFQH
jgi:hypothetical protein